MPFQYMIFLQKYLCLWGENKCGQIKPVTGLHVFSFFYSSVVFSPDAVSSIIPKIDGVSVFRRVTLKYFFEKKKNQHIADFGYFFTD